MVKTVSILTPTYDKRCDFLQFVARGICKQSYKNIKEWVIVDGTRTGVSIVPAAIEKIKKLTNIPNIVFIAQDIERKNSIGNLRNILKKKASGEILIHFDDDDFYPECRIKHAVDRLNATKLQLAGASDLYMYDVHFKSLYQFRSFGDNHILGGTMAYTKKYAMKHDFDESVTHAEEASFTNKFTETAAVLLSKKTMIASSHSMNTYSKKQIIWNNLYQSTDKKSLFYRSKTLRYASKNKKYIKDYLRTIEDSVSKLNVDFNITIFMASPGSVQNDLGTSFRNHSVHQRAKHLQSMGYSIEIYNNGGEYSDIVDDIHYSHYSQFNVSKKYENFIVWGTKGIFPFATNNLKLMTDKHIIISPELADGGYTIFQKYLDDMETIVMDNKIIADMFRDAIGLKKYQQEDWSEKTSILRSPFIRTTNKLQYTVIPKSIYICIYNIFDWDNLKKLFEIVLPQVCLLEPDTQIHIYNFQILTGSPKEVIEDKGFLTIMEQHPNVTIHGATTYEELVLEKYKYQFHLNWSRQCPTQAFEVLDSLHSSYIGCTPITNWFLTEIAPELNWKSTKKGTHLMAVHFIELLVNNLSIDTVALSKFNTLNQEEFKTHYTFNGWGEQFVKYLA